MQFAHTLATRLYPEGTPELSLIDKLRGAVHARIKTPGKVNHYVMLGSMKLNTGPLALDKTSVVPWQLETALSAWLEAEAQQKGISLEELQQMAQQAGQTAVSAIKGGTKQQAQVQFISQTQTPSPQPTPVATAPQPE